jgi:chemotaxis protein methyltransferase CheR
MSVPQVRPIPKISAIKPQTGVGDHLPASPVPGPGVVPAITPDQAEALYLQAQLLFDAENFAEASILLREVRRADPDHIGALVLQGFIAANREQYDDVLTMCNAVLTLNDLKPEVYFLKGLVLDMMDKMHEAIEEYRKAILLDMDCVMSHYNLGRLYIRQGREKDGLRELKNCLKILEKSREESIVPYSGGLTREVFLEQLRNELFKVA